MSQEPKPKIFPRVDHITLNVKDFEQSKKLYTELFVDYLSGTVEIDDPELFGIGFGNGLRIFFLFELKAENKEFKDDIFDKSRVGLHHFALELENKSAVDNIYKKLLELDIKILDKPQFYPDYVDNYYALYFQDPNGFKMEFVAYK